MDGGQKSSRGFCSLWKSKKIYFQYKNHLEIPSCLMKTRYERQLEWVIPENIQPPPQRKLEVNPFTPFRCQYTIIKTNFSCGLQKFLPWGECGSFLEQPNQDGRQYCSRFMRTRCAPRSKSNLCRNYQKGVLNCIPGKGWVGIWFKIVAYQ